MTHLMTKILSKSMCRYFLLMISNTNNWFGKILRVFHGDFFFTHWPSTGSRGSYIAGLREVLTQLLFLNMNFAFFSPF